MWKPLEISKQPAKSVAVVLSIHNHKLRIILSWEVSARSKENSKLPELLRLQERLVRQWVCYANVFQICFPECHRVTSWRWLVCLQFAHRGRVAAYRFFAEHECHLWWLDTALIILFIEIWQYVLVHLHAEVVSMGLSLPFFFRFLQLIFTRMIHPCENRGILEHSSLKNCFIVH